MNIVLLPGLDGTGLLFSRFVSALGHEFQPTVVCYPGDQALDYAEHERIARTFLPRDRPYLLLGESFSGPIAISIAASKPPGLAGLILCCTFARNPVRFYSPFRSLLPLVPFNLIPTTFLSPFIFGRFSSRSLRAEQRAAIRQVANVAMRARIKALFDVDVSAKLQQIKLPILYLLASENHVVPRAAAEHIHRIAPRVQVIELKAPHLLLQTVPDRAAAVVWDFAQNLIRRNKAEPQRH